MFAIFSMLINKGIFAFSSYLLAILLSGDKDYKMYLQILGYGVLIEALIEPTFEIMAHRASRFLRKAWYAGLIFLPFMYLNLGLFGGIVWGYYMALGKAMSMKTLPRVKKGGFYMVLSGILVSLDPLALYLNLEFLVAIFPVLASIFLLFVELEEGELDFKEIITVTLKIFGTSFFSKIAYRFIITSHQDFLAAEKAVKGLAGIPVGVLKLTASVKNEDLKITKFIAALAGLCVCLVDWRCVFLVAYNYKKAEMHREKVFSKFANRESFRSILELVVFSVALGVAEPGSGELIFLVAQIASFVIFIK